MNESSTVLSSVWTEILDGTTQMFSNNYIALALGIPVAVSVIYAVKAMFGSRKKG